MLYEGEAEQRRRGQQEPPRPTSSWDRAPCRPRCACPAGISRSGAPEPSRLVFSNLDSAKLTSTVNDSYQPGQQRFHHSPPWTPLCRHAAQDRHLGCCHREERVEAPASYLGPPDVSLENQLHQVWEACRREQNSLRVRRLFLLQPGLPKPCVTASHPV